MRRIFYAEDEPLTRRVVSAKLEKVFPDYEIEIFSNGDSLDKALNLDISEVKYVITDNQMPGINGSEIIKRHSWMYKEIEFILYTADGELIGKEAVENGAVYIPKETSNNNLINYLKDNINRD